MRRLKVLLVDDNELFRKALVEFLREQESCQTLAEACDGPAAIELARELQPDVVLMDISMPGMNGFEAARQIKKQLPDTIVIFVTVHEHETYRALAGSLAVDGFVSKTSLKRDLPKVLQRLKGGKL